MKTWLVGTVNRFRGLRAWYSFRSLVSVRAPPSIFCAVKRSIALMNYNVCNTMVEFDSRSERQGSRVHRTYLQTYYKELPLTEPKKPP